MVEIPEPPRPFVGRERELEWLDDRILNRRDWPRLQFVRGDAGVGKTALLSYFVMSHGELRDTIWINLLSTQSVDSVLIQFDDRMRRQIDSRQYREGLIVIDNADVYGSEELNAILRRVMNYKIVRGVIVATRPPISIDKSPVLDLHSLTRDESIELFRQLSTVDIPPGVLDQVIARSGGNPVLLRSMAQALNRGGIVGVGEALNVPLYEYDETVPADKVIEVVKPKLIIVSGEILAALQKEPESIFKLTSRRFEEVLAELLEARGMKVELTQPSKDGGRDIIASLETDLCRVLCLIEAKRYAIDNKVGVELVRQLYGVLTDHKGRNEASSAMLVTTSTFTKGAKEFQQKHEYEMSLKDYADVFKWIQEYKKPGSSGLILPS